MANAFFSDLLSTISERGRTLLRRGGATDAKPDGAGLIELCEALLSGRGEASGTAMAREVLDRYHDLDAAERRNFFEALVRDFGPDREKVAKAIETWRANPGDGNGGELHFASEPRRQELIRRLNRAPGGTGDLVAMRAEIEESPVGKRSIHQAGGDKAAIGNANGHSLAALAASDLLFLSNNECWLQFSSSLSFIAIAPALVRNCRAPPRALPA